MNEETLIKEIVKGITEEFYVPDDAIAKGITDAFILLYEKKVGFRDCIFEAIERGTQAALLEKGV